VTRSGPQAPGEEPEEPAMQRSYAALWKSGQICFIEAFGAAPLGLFVQGPSTRQASDARLLAAVVSGLGFLLLTLIASIIASVASFDADQWAAHSSMVRQASEHLFSLVQDAETGQRGFLLTGNDSYLEPFYTAQKEIPAAEKTLRGLTSDNAVQQSRLSKLYPLIDLKLGELSRTTELVKQGKIDEAIGVVKSNQGRDLMRDIRTTIKQFDSDEINLQSARNSKAVLLRSVLLSITVIAAMAAAIVAIVVGLTLRRQVRELRLLTGSLKVEMLERERAETTLRQAQKMEALGQLTGGVAHDFNNMLAIIVGNLDLGMRRLSGDDVRARTYVENALSGARRAAELTKRLLAFSRLQPLKPQSADVNKCVTEMSELLRRTLGESIELETVLSGGLWRAVVDVHQLESAILNLVINARDAMNGVGRLTIETANTELDRAYADAHVEVVPGQYVMIAVTDTGCGMSEAVIAKAFDPFFTTKPPGVGTGLGLSQVHGFIKQSKGHVKIYSEEGEGTTIKIYLPRDGTKVVPAEMVAPKPRMVSAPKEHVVLVVEDDPGVRAFTVSALRELGYEAIEADTADIALRKLLENPRITILLTDVVLPSGNGRELASSLVKERSDLLVLYMTGYTRNAIVHNGTLDPGVHLLSKPFTIEDLRREINAILDAKPAARAPA
jgi:signal transduction histidine kinase/CheY-like chemotaxis protein